MGFTACPCHRHRALPRSSRIRFIQDSTELASFDSPAPQPGDPRAGASLRPAAQGDGTASVPATIVVAVPFYDSRRQIALLRDAKFLSLLRNQPEAAAPLRIDSGEQEGFNDSRLRQGRGFTSRTVSDHYHKARDDGAGGLLRSAGWRCRVPPSADAGKGRQGRCLVRRQ